jgi:hypothetical protein
VNKDWCADSSDNQHHWRPLSPQTTPRVGTDGDREFWMVTNWCTFCDRPALVRMYPDTTEIFIRLL